MLQPGMGQDAGSLAEVSVTRVQGRMGTVSFTRGNLRQSQD